MCSACPALPCRAVPCRAEHLSTLATDSASQLDVLGHDGDTLGMDSAQVGVFEETDQVSLGGFLQCHHGRRLEPQVCFEVLGNLTHQALERQFPDEELGTLLVATDLTESHSTRAVTMGFLDASRGRSRLAGGLGGQLLARGLASCRLASSLLGTCHGCCCFGGYAVVMWAVAEPCRPTHLGRPVAGALIG